MPSLSSVGPGPPGNSKTAYQGGSKINGSICPAKKLIKLLKILYIQKISTFLGIQIVWAALDNKASA
jgi:hypothetical protein